MTKSSDSTFGVAIVMLVMLIVLWFPAAWVFMIAWNASIVFMFGAPIIGYWHAFWALLVLAFIKPSTPAQVSK